MEACCRKIQKWIFDHIFQSSMFFALIMVLVIFSFPFQATTVVACNSRAEQRTCNSRAEREAVLNPGVHGHLEAGPWAPLNVQAGALNWNWPGLACLGALTPKAELCPNSSRIVCISLYAASHSLSLHRHSVSSLSPLPAGGRFSLHQDAGSLIPRLQHLRWGSQAPVCVFCSSDFLPADPFLHHTFL